MTPTICKACGGPIENPDGRHVCEKCEAGETVAVKSVDARIAECLQQSMIGDKEPSHLERWASIVFWLLLGGFAIVSIVWGFRQLL